MRVILIASLVSLSLPAHGQDLGRCAKKDTTVAIVDCLNRERATWDKRLNASYQVSLKRAGSPKVRRAMVEDQRDWIKWRDKRCKEAAQGDGSLVQIEVAGCFMEQTRNRVIEIEEDLGTP
jgi:uncharacterized protein YecT (DUF1311 family)